MCYYPDFHTSEATWTKTNKDTMKRKDIVT